MTFVAPWVEDDSKFDDLLASKKIFMVGAGGIGCELLKNLVLTGFRKIHVIDLDIIELSNLNRQFLFQKEHVHQPKATVACEAVKSLCDDLDITAHHANIFDRDYNDTFFKQFDLVLNALDNRAARVHVNRMCLVSDIPLIESGSAGYLGQVTVIKKGVSECYECRPKPVQRTFPGCTIRNTPSEPIHCIVWAKHLFNQLFGEPDIDEDVAPDVADPELTENNDSTANGTTTNGTANNNNGAGGASSTANGSASTANGSQNGTADVVKEPTEKFSTSKWAAETGFDAQQIFNKLFNKDVEYLLTMDKLWKKRRPPTPLDWANMSDQNAGSSSQVAESAASATNQIRDQQVWTPEKCRQVFVTTVDHLAAKIKADPTTKLIWDKDDDVAMDFVAAVANLRSHIFGIVLKSRFDVKSMAGNIVPAIASTNAIVAGLIVMEALKVVHNQSLLCKSVFITRQPNPRGKILVDQQLDPPNEKCFVCAPNVEVSIKLNVNSLTVATLENSILKKALNMVAPDVSVDNNMGTIVISSEPGETDALAQKTLHELGIADGTRLICDDFVLKMEFKLHIVHSDSALKDNVEFEILTDDLSALAAASAEPVTENADKPSADAAIMDAEPSSAAADPTATAVTTTKRKLSGETDPTIEAKKSRSDTITAGGDADVVELD